MKCARIRLLRYGLFGIILALAPRDTHAQFPGDSTQQQLRDDIERLRIEFVEHHQEMSARNQTLQKELETSQREAQALLSQLLETQTQLGQARSGEELARLKAANEALEAQLAERKAAFTQLEENYAEEITAVKQENEALLQQLLAAQSQLKQSARGPTEEKPDQQALLQQIEALKAQIRQLESHASQHALEMRPGSLESSAGALPAIIITQGTRSADTLARQIRTYFVTRNLFPRSPNALQFEEIALTEIHPEPLYLYFFIEPDELGNQEVKCVVQTAAGVYLSDSQQGVYYDKVLALLSAIFTEK